MPLTQCLRPIYTAVDETTAAAALDALEVAWGTRYPAIVRLWRGRWEQFVPFLAFPLEVRRSSLPSPRRLGGAPRPT